MYTTRSTGSALRHAASLSLLLAIAATATSTRSTAQRAPVNFERQILPILQDRCFLCHRAEYRDERDRLRKPKAGLRLDGRGWILKGSDDNVVLVPDQPEKSLLYSLTVLPEDDSDRMPGKGDPLGGEQTGLLRRWIADGADFGDWTGEEGPEAAAPVVVPARVQLLERLGRGLRPASASAVARASGDVTRITPVLPDSALLRVQCLSHEDRVDDQVVAGLGTLRGQLAHLHLGRTRVTDKALETIGNMPRLVRLDLHETAITDRGLRHLRRATELRYLNLYGTAVTDAGLDEIARLANLEAVYLWNTRVTAKGAKALGKKLLGARIHHRLVLPQPEAGEEEGEGRRRRGKRGKKRKSEKKQGDPSLDQTEKAKKERGKATGSRKRRIAARP